jgi:hypothetical protein
MCNIDKKAAGDARLFIGIDSWLLFLINVNAKESSLPADDRASSNRIESGTAYATNK